MQRQECRNTEAGEAMQEHCSGLSNSGLLSRELGHVPSVRQLRQEENPGPALLAAVPGGGELPWNAEANRPVKTITTWRHAYRPT